MFPSFSNFGSVKKVRRRGQRPAGRQLSSKSTRQFQVNPEKNAWYCFGCKQGGNVLDFVAKRERVGVRKAALKLDEWFGLGLAEAPEKTSPAAAPAAPPKSPASAPPEPESMPTANPPLDFSLKTLDAKHPSLLDLGLEAATLEYFGAGYCAKGLMKAGSRPRSITARGKLVAYAGLALDAATTPRYLFPPKFHPGLEVFNRDCFAEAEGPSTSRPRSRASCGSPSLASSPCSASSTGRSPKPRRRRKLRSSRPHAPDLPTPLGNPAHRGLRAAPTAATTARLCILLGSKYKDKKPAHGLKENLGALAAGFFQWASKNARTSLRD
jgi:hypothetical protein